MSCLIERLGVLDKPRSVLSVMWVRWVRIFQPRPSSTLSQVGHFLSCRRRPSLFSVLTFCIQPVPDSSDQFLVPLKECFVLSCEASTRVLDQSLYLALDPTLAHLLGCAVSTAFVIGIQHCGITLRAGHLIIYCFDVKAFLWRPSSPSLRIFFEGFRHC